MDQISKLTLDELKKMASKCTSVVCNSKFVRADVLHIHGWQCMNCFSLFIYSHVTVQEHTRFFISNLIALSDESHSKAINWIYTLDAYYRSPDEYINMINMKYLNDIVQTIGTDFLYLSDSILLSLLTVTFPVKNQLGLIRDNLYSNTFNKMVLRLGKNKAEKAMVGLK